jgi:hypothetical protein
LALHFVDAVGKAGGGLFISNKYYLKKSTSNCGWYERIELETMINTHATSVHQHQKNSFVQVCVNIKNYSVAWFLFFWWQVYAIFVNFFEKIVFFQ